MSTDNKSQDAANEAIRRLCTKCLHQCFWLPETADHPKLRITFSTTTNFEDKSLPVILFCLPMFGTRWMNLLFDKHAVKEGVRVICVDRPGMGGSTPVPRPIRLQVWLETVPALLSHLSTTHISLMSHSAGTLYLLNTLSTHRHILDPTTPYVGLLAPWVHHSDSGKSLMTAASKIPDSIFGAWDKVNSFVAGTIMPASEWSGGVLSAAAEFFQMSSADENAENAYAEIYGVEPEVAEQLRKYVSQFAVAESWKGGNDEALFCLKQVPSYGACESYPGFVRDVGEMERGRGGEGKRLRVQAFFAESDIMIGKGGQEFFDRCWMKEGVSEFVEYKTQTVEGTSHDTIVDPRKGPVQEVFRYVAENCGKSA